MTAVNDALADNPELVNEDCYGEGWMLEIQPESPTEIESLNDAGSYAQSVRDRSD